MSGHVPSLKSLHLLLSFLQAARPFLPQVQRVKVRVHAVFLQLPHDFCDLLQQVSVPHDHVAQLREVLEQAGGTIKGNVTEVLPE